jgi:hypothetical protein
MMGNDTWLIMKSDIIGIAWVIINHNESVFFF